MNAMTVIKRIMEIIKILKDHPASQFSGLILNIKSLGKNLCFYISKKRICDQNHRHLSKKKLMRRTPDKKT